MSTAYRRHHYRRRHSVSAADRELLFVFGAGLLAFAAIAGTVIGAVAIAGGFDAPSTNLNFPRPAGYSFHSWHLKHTITICVDPEGGPTTERPLVDLVRDAVAGWQHAAAGHVPLAVDSLCPGRGLRHGDGQNVVGWANLSDALGQANVHSNSFDGVTEADVTLRPDMNPSADCVLSILLHEVGHIAGMAHQSIGASSVMTPSVACGTSLSWSDIAAVRFRYH